MGFFLQLLIMTSASNLEENPESSRNEFSGKENVILFDGVCNLCDGWVKLIIERDPKGYFFFAPLQSEAGQRLLNENKLSPEYLKSIVLLENGRTYFGSTSVLRTCRKMKGLWPLIYVFILVPAPIRDFFYDWVASRRYQWFGRKESCLIPSADIKSRFID